MAVGAHPQLDHVEYRRRSACSLSSRAYSSAPAFEIDPLDRHRMALRGVSGSIAGATEQVGDFMARVRRSFVLGNDPLITWNTAGRANGAAVGAGSEHPPRVRPPLRATMAATRAARSHGRSRCAATRGTLGAISGVGEHRHAHT